MRLISGDVSLHRPGIEKIVHQYMKETPQYWKGLIGEDMSTKLAFDRLKAVSDFGDAVAINEGTDIPVSDIQTPFQRDFEVVAYGLGYEVSGQAAYTDSYNQLKKPTENLMKSMYDARERGAANLLTLGHTVPASGGTWTLDNVALFSASHPLNAAVDSNTGSTALGITALETAIQTAMQVRTYMGKVSVGPKKWKLVVPTSLLMLASRLVESAKFPTTNDNDPNVAGNHLSVVWNPYLTDTNNWYLIPGEDRYNPLFRIHRMSLQMVSHKLERRPGDMFYGFHEEYGYGAKDYRHTFGAAVT
jgi:hypothetical protein